jgi:hypothetical protein
MLKNNGCGYLAAAVLSVGCLLMPARSDARQDLSIDFPDGALRCSDVRVRSTGQVAQAAESFTISAGAALEIAGVDRGNIRVRGWDRPDYAVEVCKIAAAGDRASADNTLRGVSVTRGGNRIASGGPSGGDSQWMVVFIVQAPKGAALDLETGNGPIDARNVSGTLKARAANGPIAIRDCQGTIEARVNNGPISFTGGGGDVRLNATNGPISVSIAGENWQGTQLEARTVNGPLRAVAPDTFRSGVRVETSGYSPLSCSLDACRNARSETTGNLRILEINGSSPAVRLSTGNGPVSLGAARNGGGVI